MVKKLHVKTGDTVEFFLYQDSYALDIRKSFYEEIGFTLLESEFVWERLHDAEPDGGKGVL